MRSSSELSELYPLSSNQTFVFSIFLSDLPFDSFPLFLFLDSYLFPSTTFFPFIAMYSLSHSLNSDKWSLTLVSIYILSDSFSFVHLKWP